MAETQGERVADLAGVTNEDAAPGVYCPAYDGGEIQALWFRLPTGTIGRIANVGHGSANDPEWTITEGDGGAVTVDPSIEQHEIKNEQDEVLVPAWHGYLKAGVWDG